MPSVEIRLREGGGKLFGEVRRCKFDERTISIIEESMKKGKEKRRNRKKKGISKKEGMYSTEENRTD